MRNASVRHGRVVFIIVYKPVNPFPSTQQNKTRDTKPIKKGAVILHDVAQPPLRPVKTRYYHTSVQLKLFWGVGADSTFAPTHEVCLQQRGIDLWHSQTVVHLPRSSCSTHALFVDPPSLSESLEPAINLDYHRRDVQQ